MKKQPLRIELRHFSQVLVLGVLFITVLFAFQNCGGPLEGEDELSSVANNAPYPYNAKADSIAFMSCQNMSGYDQNAFFSYRLQAFKNSGSGLKLNANFVSATGGYGPDKRAEVIKLQKHASGGHLQFAIRNFSDFQSSFLFGAQYRDGFDHANYPVAVSDSSITDILAGEVSGNYINSALPAPIQLDLDFLQGAQLQSVNEKFASAEAFLALSLAPMDTVRAAGPNGITASDSIYGQGLIPSFGKPSGISGAAKNFLTHIDEFDPETRKPVDNWVCPSNLRFVIVRKNDKGRDVNCLADENASDPASSTRLSLLRRVLPFSDWAVDLNNNCVLPKKSGSCYGTENTSLNIAYPNTPQTSCDPQQNNCPHYISICYKN